jgi:prepilin-type N-terminal cleavage/methylation domain-containing protein
MIFIGKVWMSDARRQVSCHPMFNAATVGGSVMMDRMRLGMEKVKLGAKAGVTLVELLVVMLIVVILSVSLVPFLRDYIVRAHYAAEAVPVVGDLRTKIELHRYEPGYLPGVTKPVERNLVGGSSSISGSNGVFSALQTWSVDTNNPALPVYTRAIYDLAASNAVPVLNAADHFSRDINVEYQHLSGKRLRPNHVFYRTDAANVNQEAYTYAVGVFGDGVGLRAGSGYAVLEVYNPAPNVNLKMVATWERFVEPGRGDDVRQILMVENGDTGVPTWTGGSPAAQGEDALTRGYCALGNLSDSGLLSATATDVETALDFLRAAGWKFDL